MKWLDSVVSMVRFCGFYLLVSVEAVLHSKFNLLTMSQSRDKDPPPSKYLHDTKSLGCDTVHNLSGFPQSWKIVEKKWSWKVMENSKNSEFHGNLFARKKSHGNQLSNSA